MTRAGEATESAILVERIGAVLVITLNRPQVRNAINLAMAESIADAIEEFDTDSDARVAVITGAGSSFCAGMDLKAFAQGEKPSVRGSGFAGIVERPPRKPIIAAVEGYALAGGFEIALSCDLLVAGRAAMFGIPEATRGLAAVGGGLLRLPRRVPYHAAMELALTGDPFSAGRMYELGLLNRIVDDGAALSTALDLAERIAANSPISVRTSKQIIVESVDWPREDLFVRQAPFAKAIMESADAQEGARAFVERRPPVWRT